MEAYLKKLCFEYQVDEKKWKSCWLVWKECIWIKEKRLLLLQCPSRACTIIVSGILHTFTTQQGEDKTVRFLSEGDAILCYNTSKHSVKTLTRCVAYYISEDEIEELCATSITFPIWFVRWWNISFTLKRKWVWMHVNWRSGKDTFLYYQKFPIFCTESLWSTLLII